jgi:hypothetical protein
MSLTVAEETYNHLESVFDEADSVALGAGYETFAPGDASVRAHIVTFLYRIEIGGKDR